jgi:uncharacterized protein GlcG (DUF336 family)
MNDLDERSREELVAMLGLSETWALEFPGVLSAEAVQRIRHQLADIMPGKRVVVVQEGAHFRALEPLDAAWAEAVVAAKEKGYTLTLSARPDGWLEATATSADGKHEITDAEYVAGPVAALHALAAKLRGEG